MMRPSVRSRTTPWPRVRPLVRYPLAVAALVSMVPLAADAAVYHLSPDSNWFPLLSSADLQPGDEVVLSEGVYSHAGRMSMGHRGSADRPIVIRAAPGARVVITRPDARQNVINIEGAQYLTLQGLEITGGSAGIRIGSRGNQPARFVTLQDNHIHHVGDVAVSANQPGNRYEGMQFLRNHIHHTAGAGEGFYLGCNNNQCQFFDGIIAGNYIHDLRGPDVKQGDGIEIKDGSYNNIVRDNVIHDTHYPGIIAYGTAGNGGRNIIERNIIWNSDNQGIQVAADAVVRNNIVLSGGAEALRSQNHQSATPGNLTIVHNTLISDRHVALHIASPVTAPVLIANNALYARNAATIRVPGPDQLTISGNIGVGATVPSLPPVAFNRSGNLANDFLGLDWRGPRRNVFPAPYSALIGSGDARFVADDDFNSTPRRGARDVGAYRYDPAGNPGWSVTTGTKRGQK